uniref:Protein Wnt n=1 Tax=Dendrocoelum lacteum TaxID=27895 RepID=T1E100_9PLAT
MNFNFAMLGKIVLISFIIKNNTCIRWLGLGKLMRVHEQEMDGFTQAECDDAKSIEILRGRHYKFCVHQKHRFAMHAVYMASKAASFYCMRTFKDRRWNCKSIEDLPKLSAELTLGTQEQAIVHAFSSAAILFEISRRCSQSKLRHCPCGRDNLQNKPSGDSQSGTFYHSSCTDNVEMGMEYAKKFLGYERMKRNKKENILKQINYAKTTKERKVFLKRINGHNYAAGLEIMKRSWKSKCKCHGVSGSCTNQVCFRQLRRLDDDILLMKLKNQYLAAKYVTAERNGILYTDPKNKIGLEDTELAFMEHSSDYCDPEPKVGSVGTVNRQCEIKNVTTADTNHCNIMCCGRGFRNTIEQETIQCKCNLDQNFNVKCKLCTVIKENKFCL